MSIEAALRVAGQALAKASGLTVTIQRGGLMIVDVPCALGTSPFDVIAADGSAVTIRSQDFLIAAEEYDFGNGPVEPLRGDLIIRAQDDGNHSYELLDLPGEPSWRWSGPWHQRLRLHTKEIAKP